MMLIKQDVVGELFEFFLRVIKIADMTDKIN
jgi:hypothetical protein